MAKRDWRKPRVDAVRAEATSTIRLEGADPLGTRADLVLCERCFGRMTKGTPMRRVNRAESPSGEGGYVHTDTELCARLREEEEQG